VRSLDIQTEREDALGYMTDADYDGEYTYFFAEVSSTYQLANNWKLTPTLDLTHSKIKQDGFAETGASPFALEVDEQSNKSLRGTLRARVAYDWEQGSSHLMTYLQAGVAHEFKDSLHVINARFVGDDGNFTVHGASYHGTSALVAVGMTAILNDTWSIDAAYNGEFSSNYDNHGISLNVNAAL
jgi:outer membrane autotransporter protein